MKDEFLATVATCNPKNIRYPPLSLKIKSVFETAVIVVHKTLERSEVDEGCLAKSLLYICNNDPVFAYALSIVYFNCGKVREIIERCNDKMGKVYVDNLKYVLYKMFFSGV